MDTSTARYTWTYDEYARLPDDGNRYEVLLGEVLVTPSPSPIHQHILATLIIALRGHVERERLGVVLPDVDLLFVEGQLKPRRYRDFGVPEYGVVDPEEKVVWVWRFADGATEAERVEGRLEWKPEGARESVVLRTEDFFKPM